MPSTWFTTLSITTAVLALSGCAVQSVQPGTPQAEVVARYGQPGRVVPLPTGSRLQYSLQPMGQSAVMVDLDANGRVTSAREVLNAASFARVVPGQWTRATAEAEFGRPASIDHVMSWQGDIMAYRWLDINQSMFFWLYLDANQVVQRVGQGMELPTLDKDPN